MRNINKFFNVFLLVVLCFFSFFRIFPLKHIEKMHIAYFNPHHYVYASEMSLKIRNGIKSIFGNTEKRKYKYDIPYHNNPSAFWLALVFAFFPEETHKLIYGIVNIVLFFAFIIFICSLREKIEFLLIFIPFAMAQFTLWTVGGDIIGHLPSICFSILSYIKLKKFLELRLRKFLIESAFFSCLGIFFNSSFAVLFLFIFLCHINYLRKKEIFLILLINSFNLPLVLAFLIPYIKYYVPLINYWKLEKIMFDSHLPYPLIFASSDIFLPVRLIQAIYPLLLILRRRINSDALLLVIGTLLKLLVLVENFSVRASFLYNKFIPFFVFAALFNIVNGSGKKLLVLLSTISYFSAVFIILVFPSFSDFKYEDFEMLFSKIKMYAEGKNILIETPVWTHHNITENALSVSTEVNAKVFGYLQKLDVIFYKRNLFWSEGDNYEIAKSNLIDISDERFKDFLNNRNIEFVLCQTYECSDFLREICHLVIEHYIKFEKSHAKIFKFNLFRCV